MQKQGAGVQPTSAGVGAGAVEVRGFDPADFHSRWTRARLAALHDAASWERGRFASEEAALGKLDPSSRESVLRAVFDASRAFGINVSRRFGVTFELVEDECTRLGANPLPAKWSTDSAIHPELSCGGSVGCLK